MIEVNDEKVIVEHYPDGTQKIANMYFCCGYCENYHIKWKYESEEEFSTLVFLALHLKGLPYVKTLGLKMYYLPNARMDRIHSGNEVFTLKSFAQVINWIGFNYVIALDVHSNVSSALFNKFIDINPKIYISNTIYEIKNDTGIFDGDIVLYYPDAGAAKRYSSIEKLPYCYGEKNRDWNTGEILGLNIVTNGIDLRGKTVIMIDDIISYGGSMYYSAKALKELEVGKIFAYASHTENSILDKEKGTLIKLLEDGTVERLYTTESLFTGEHEKIEVMKL